MSADWEYREVCPDGACIGVIGDDGLCKVCGRAAPNWGNERTRGLVAEQPDVAARSDVPGDEATPDDDDGDDDDDADADEADEAGEAGEWDERALCDNGACVGVIGDDGTCSICGSRPA
jgi:hypothetical protein